MRGIITELKLTSGGFLEFFVLKLLSERSHSPQEIHDHLKDAGLRIPMGSIYPLLHRFRVRGYVERGYEESETGSALRTYDLSSKGERRFADLRDDWKRLNGLVAGL